ncbi:MAG: hypothetical protein HC910_22915 [Spirulinaceae cyanobacterium SM2_1_0]|nr:hypothetical protein [Spirulinaceae cyanobacterium SM2_1_0]
MPRGKPGVSLCVRIDPDLSQNLVSAATQAGLTKTALVEQALTDYLGKLQGSGISLSQPCLASLDRYAREAKCSRSEAAERIFERWLPSAHIDLLYGAAKC